MINENEFLRGWLDADDAILHKLPGYRDYSQGDSDWDKGWNYRIAQEKENNETMLEKWHKLNLVNPMKFPSYEEFVNKYTENK